MVNPAVDASSSDAHDKQSFQGVVEVLAAELFNPAASQNVRKNVQTCLGFLAKRWGTEVSELLEPLHGPLLNMLVGRPLRAKHAEAQASALCYVFVFFWSHSFLPLRRVFRKGLRVGLFSGCEVFRLDSTRPGKGVMQMRNKFGFTRLCLVVLPFISMVRGIGSSKKLSMSSLM